MNNLIWMVPIGLLGLWFYFQRETLAAEALEVLQLPAHPQNDRPWTGLDELVLDVARHDVLATWHESGRHLLRDTPVHNVNVDGEWDAIADGFGKDIWDRYAQLFHILSAMPRRKRKAVLHASKSKSLDARTKLLGLEIRQPDGTIRQFPSWMTN